MYIRLISALLSCAFVLAILGQQVIPSPHPQIGSAQQTYEVAIDFNRRVSMRVYDYDLDLWNTCQLYRKGHRFRIEISSSAFPKYDRNLNTGEALGQTTRMQVAEQKIYHDGEHSSYVVLPIVPRKR